MKEALNAVLMVVLFACMYSLGYLRSRQQILRCVFMRWGEWRDGVLDSAMTTTNHDEKVALIEVLERDGEAYDAAWKAYESLTPLRDGKPYTRKEVAA